MTISKFLNDKFNLDVICDEEGVYSYIIHTIDNKVKLDKVSSNISFYLAFEPFSSPSHVLSLFHRLHQCSKHCK